MPRKPAMSFRRIGVQMKGRIAVVMSRNGYKLKFDENGIGVCPESGERYFLEDKVLQVVI